jgi:hypothetical protein
MIYIKSNGLFVNLGFSIHFGIVFVLEMPWTQFMSLWTMTRSWSTWGTTTREVTASTLEGGGGQCGAHHGWIMAAGRLIWHGSVEWR